MVLREMADQWEQRLTRIKEELDSGEEPEEVTVRTLLSWFDAQRRGYWVVRSVRQALESIGLATEPDFEFAYIDAPISFALAEGGPSRGLDEAIDDEGDELGPVAKALLEALREQEESSRLVAGAIGDPTYRIGKLPSANTTLVSVKPDATLQEAVTLMIAHDFSQLPVMQSEREVKGMVSWRAIGKHLALGLGVSVVKECMERPYIIDADVSLFLAIDGIVRNEYVLVRSQENIITGIVTTSDLSRQFLELGEPFLLIGEIENHVRRLIDGRFTQAELRDVRDPSDRDRNIESVADLTFGEYVRLLENPNTWEKVGLGIDRRVFVEHLNRVRRIRNEVMHFDPDGIPEVDLAHLRQFLDMMRELRTMGAY